MPSISVGNIKYFYTDSDAPVISDYTTLIMIHGHTFHSGTFQRLLPLAPSKSLRIICINRRGYPGTTPFSPEELKTLESGTGEERTKLIEQQGIDLALLVHTLISKCHLPQNGGVTIAGWSLGNIFLLSLFASVTLLPPNVQDNLKSFIKGFILWDPPSQSLGAADPPGSYVPLWDETIPLEARGPAFAVWVSSYWKHGDLSTHNTGQLNYRDPEESKKSSVANMNQAELSSAMDVAGPNYDTFWVKPDFAEVLANQTHKAFFDSPVREAWAGKLVTNLYGDSNVWIVINGNWVLQDMIKAAGMSEPFMKFEVIKGANHFVMWDEPETALDSLIACMSV